MKKIGPLAPFDLRCNYLQDPLGIDDPIPKFSWLLEHSDRGETQKAYQIIVSSEVDRVDKGIGDIWDTGKVYSSESNNLTYEGLPLKSSTRYYWRVRWWDSQERVSPYSEISFFETPLVEISTYSRQNSAFKTLSPFSLQPVKKS